MPTQPAYLNLIEKGELNPRSNKLLTHLKNCNLCPRNCGVDRTKKATGFCKAGELIEISSICAHNGEEPVISGTKGSGTIFFAHCNLKCAFCQNFQISQEDSINNLFLTPDELANKMLYLQNSLGVHNINLVSPTHYAAQILKAVSIAAHKGLCIPLVYNTNAYDSVDILKFFDGVVDVYLPDLKYADDKLAIKYSQAPKYSEFARAAIKEMYNQVGNLQVDKKNIVKKGIIVRHLVLPNDLAGSEKSLSWLSNEISKDVAISIMSQYSPCNNACNFPELNRKLTNQEYEKVLEIVEILELENGWLQGMPSADYYLPDFESDSHPFEN